MKIDSVDEELTHLQRPEFNFYCQCEDFFSK